MDKANFAFTLNGKRYVMENMVLIADNAISDPEYCEYELAIFVAELLEEKTKLMEQVGLLKKEIKKLKESNEAYRQEVKELRFGP